MNRLRPAFLFVLVLIGAAPAAIAQKKFTVEWMYSRDANIIDFAPEKYWTADGAALLFDARKMGDGLMRLDPKTQKIEPAVDRRKASRALRNAGAQLPGVLWPDGFDDAGKRALYADGADLYVLDLPTIEVYKVTDTPQVEEKSPRISPNGERVAYVVANDLYVYDIKSKATTRLTTDGAEARLNGTLSWVYWEEVFGRQDIGYWWSPDSNAIAYLQTDESNVLPVSFVDFQPATPIVHTQRYPKAGAENPKVKVGVITLGAAEPKTTWVDLAEKEYEYVARVNWLPDGSKFIVQTMNRAQTEIDVRLASPADGKAKILFTEKDKGWVNITDDLVFFKKSPEFLWVSERTGFAHIYRYKLDGTLVGAVTSGEWAVRDTGAVYWLHQAIKCLDEEHGYVYFNSLKKSSIENQVYRAKLDGSEVVQITEERGVHAPTFSKDGAYFLDEHSNSTTPKHLTLRTADGKAVSEPSPSMTEALKELDIVYPEFLTVPAADGFEMPAYVFKPKNFDASKKYPVIIYTYGGPSAPSVSDQFNASDLWYAQILMQEGYVYACIDNRSATAKSKNVENTILGEMYGKGELADVVAGVKWLKSQPWVDPERVGIWGWSGGGSCTLMSMTRSKEFKAGIAVAGVTRWEYYDTKWGEASMKRPQDNPDGYRATDLTSYANHLHGRLMIVHGTYDDNVHIQNTWHFVDELVKAGKLFELMIYPMRKHGIEDLPARVHLYKTMVDFWKRSL